MALNDGDGNREIAARLGEDASADADSDLQRLSSIEIPATPRVPAPPELEFKRPAISQKALHRAFPGLKEDAFGGISSGFATEKQPSHLGAGLVIGITFPACIIVGASIGIWIDHHWIRAAPWGTVAMTLIGIAAGLMNVFRALQSMGVGKSKSGGK